LGRTEFGPKRVTIFKDSIFSSPDFQMDKKPRRGILSFIFILTAVIFMGVFSWSAETKEKRLNVLLISIDTIRPDRLSCYSTAFVQTPNIDRLAARGNVFERAFAHNPTTLPSHANILLGTTPLHHGVHDNSKFKVADEFLTIAEYLKDLRYATGAFIGAFPLDSRFGLAQGFDVYDESYPSDSSTKFAAPERRAEEVIKRAIEWISGQRSNWFSFVHLWDPHTPYSPPEPFKTQYKEDPYSGEAAYVDSELGKLFDFMEQNDLFPNTLVILTGDHGESLGEHGELTHSYFAYNSTMWVPLIISAPGLDPGRTDVYVCHADIFPTVCDILQTDKLPVLQGISLLPAMRGKNIKNRSIYIESLDPFYNRGAAPLRGFIERGKKFLDSPVPEFYDLEKDFHEKNNEIQKIDVAEKKKKLNDLMENFSSSPVGSTPSQLDQEALRRLRSLGYVSSAQSRLKESYGPADDLKTILPYQKKLDAAITLFDEGQMDDSIRLLEEIISEKKDMVRAYIYLFSLFQAKGQPEKALELLEEGYQHNPENYDIVTAYGMLLSEKGEIDRSIALLQKGLAMIDFDPKTWNLLGIAFWRRGDEQKAEEHYRKALSLDPNSAKTYSNLGALYFSKSMRTLDRAEYSKAMEFFKKAIEYDPNMVIAYRGLGLGYKAVGRLDDAISVWEKALTIDPADDFIHLNLGKAHLEQGNKARALEYLEQFLHLRKDSLSLQERKEVEALIQKCRK
jgi:arylsulfatase A-like enzyme/Tfp pilus assembly protein PilF